MTGRAGVTLVELMVVLAVLAVMAGVVGLAWRPNPRLDADGAAPITALRRRAVESGRIVTGVVTLAGRQAAVIAFPDGRVAGAERLGINPLTGAKSDADTLAP
jgi:prepilin-type N-terminal cleavage/methylation domain-containing protein